VRECDEADDSEVQEEARRMIYFTQRRKLGELYKQWIIDNHVYDCPSSVVDFLQVKGLLNEQKTYEFLAVKTSSLIDDEGIRQENHKEDIVMANKNDIQENKGNEVPAVPEEPKTPEEQKKENVFKRMGRKAWHGVCKVGRAIKESPWTHLATGLVGVATVLTVEEVARRKYSGTDEAIEDQDESVETEFLDQEEPDDIGPTDEDEMTE
jgi:hypothetical protein